MEHRKLGPDDLRGKRIDVHSHVGVSVRAYARMEYPYSQTVEDLAYKQRTAGVDVNVVFPFSPDLHFDLPSLVEHGAVRAARSPLSLAPYGSENRLVMREVFDYASGSCGRFLPFVSVDPGREIDDQLGELTSLESEYPIYGMKIVGVACQSRVTALLTPLGSRLLDFAEERNLTVLFHTTSTSDDEYSHARDVLRVVAARPGIRCCLAHALIFHRGFLDEAARLPNAWVDTAAMKIQVDFLNDSVGHTIRREDLIDADFSDYRKVMQRLCELYPDRVLWGTDSPAYTYICMRKQGEGVYREFAYRGSYEGEIEALNALDEKTRLRISSENTLHFLFGGA